MKLVKDVAAGAVLLVALTAVVVGLLVLGPPLWGVAGGWIKLGIQDGMVVIF